MEDPRIISALFIFLKMAYYNVLINSFDINFIYFGGFIWTKMANFLIVLKKEEKVNFSKRAYSIFE